MAAAVVAASSGGSDENGIVGATHVVCVLRLDRMDRGLRSERVCDSHWGKCAWRRSRRDCGRNRRSGDAGSGNVFARVIIFCVSAKAIGGAKRDNRLQDRWRSKVRSPARSPLPAKLLKSMARKTSMNDDIAEIGARSDATSDSRRFD